MLDGNTLKSITEVIAVNFYSYQHSSFGGQSISMDMKIKGMKKIMSDSWPIKIRKARSLIEWVDKERENDIISENVALIKTIPQELHARICAYIKSIFRGRRSREDFIAYLIRIGDVSVERAELIADDQIAKCAEKFLVEKWKKQGIRFVRWVHRGASEPRKYHLKKWNGRNGRRTGMPNGLNGFIFPIDKPPIIDVKTHERGYPGQLVNCHCHLEPIRLAKPLVKAMSH